MKKKRGININIHLSNRWLYTFIILGILAIIGVGVYAVQQASSGGTHNYAEIGFPSCSNGKILKWSSGAWNCGDDNYEANTDYCSEGSCAGNLNMDSSATIRSNRYFADSSSGNMYIGEYDNTVIVRGGITFRNYLVSEKSWCEASEIGTIKGCRRRKDGNTVLCGCITDYDAPKGERSYWASLVEPPPQEPEVLW
jgi:hypothetical protein